MGKLRSSWEQLEGESAKAFKAFVCYLEMPAKTRSVIAAYLAYSGRREAKNKLKTPGFFNDWASKNQWRKRAKAFDEHQLNERLAGVADVRKKALVVAWDAIVETIESQQANLESMDAAEKSRWIAVLSGVVKLQQEGDIPNLDDYVPTADDLPDVVEVGPDGVVH